MKAQKGKTPPTADELIARAKAVKADGVDLAAHIHVPKDGPFKSDHYRY